MEINKDKETTELRNICWLKMELELQKKLSEQRNKILNIFGINKNNKE